MKKISILLVALILFSSLSFGCSASISEDEAKGISEEYLSLFIAKDFDAMLAYPTEDSVKEALNKEMLSSAYESLSLPGGNYEDMQLEKSEKISSGYSFDYNLNFENAIFTVNVAVDKKGEISSFVLKESRRKNAPEIPETIMEEEVSFGKKPYIISGTISLPKKTNGKIPAVIIVHGSGPNNRDGLINLNTPYKDIAWALSQRGIAVLRYDKRTYTYGAQIVKEKNLTVYDETIDDAAYAYELLKEDERIDSDNIYFIGHSMGGYLLPRIWERANAKGLIALAASASPMEDLIVKQYKYLQSKGDDSITDETIASYEKIRDNIKSLTEENQGDYSLVSLMNAPASYWLDLKSYDPVKAAAGLDCPMIYIQGDKDYQVTVEEFDKYRQGLKDKNNVSFALVNNVNHLLNENCEYVTNMDYLKAGDVSEKVVDAIANFILGN